MTITVDRVKRRGERIAGIVADAAALGVTRGHLWEVLKGRRKSPDLLARYEELKNPTLYQMRMNPETLSKQRIPMPPELAALQNLSPFFFKTLAALKVEILILRFDAAQGSPILNHNDIGSELDAELADVQGASLDSDFFPLGEQWYFFHVPKPKLGAAAHKLKDALVTRGLLKISSIFHAEDDHFLRKWYPGTSEGVELSPDDA